MTAQRIKKPCAMPGCPEKVERGYCADHARVKSRERGSSAERGYDGAWRKVRKMYLAQNPVCERCDCQLSMEAHHIDRDPTGPNRLRFSNLEALCKECHHEEHR